MPIERSFHFQDLSQTAFDSLDSVVMRQAYVVQNKLGRLFDERIYENEIADRLRREGLEVHTQLPVKVSHSSFEKTYFLDLVVDHMVYELKVVGELMAAHRAQALHYAMLNDVRRTKLINFRSPKVDGELLYNPLKTSHRHIPLFEAESFETLTPNCERLFNHVRSLISDWGTHLSSSLYNEAIVHHFGGEAECQVRIRVGSEDNLGTHLIQSHAPGHSFVVTGFTRQISQHRNHLQRLLNNVDLRAIQWINFNRSKIEFTTLTK